MNKKMMIIIFIIVSVLIAISLQFVSFNIFEREIVEDNLQIDQYIEEIGLDPSKLLVSQKQFIYDLELEPLKEFEKTDYIIPALKPYGFYRNWELESKLDREKKSKIKLEGYLFHDKKHNEFSIMVNYTIPYQFTYDQENTPFTDYIEVKAADKYNIHQMLGYGICEIRNREYNIQGYVEEGIFILRKNYLEDSDIKVKIDRTITGFVWFNFREYDNFEDEDFFECVVNVYDYYPVTNTEIILGYNSFKNTGIKIKEKYIPQSIRVSYQKEGI